MYALLNPLYRVYSFFYSVFSALNRGMVCSASAFGVVVHSSLLGLLWLFAVYGLVLWAALAAPAWLALAALGFGLYGVLAIGRAWAGNEKKRRHIAKKMDNTSVDELPDLRWRALASALMLLWLLPLFFQRVHERFGSFEVKDHDHFLGWFWFILDKTYLGSLPAFLDLYPEMHITSIAAISPEGRILLFGSRLLFYYYVIQTILSVWAIRTNIHDAITAVRTDPEMAVRIGRRALWPLLRRLGMPALDQQEKCQIIKALGHLRCPEARKPLLGLIHDQAVPREVRGEAVLALGELGGPEACAFIGDLLNEAGDPILRMRAAEALERLQGPAAIDPLLRKLRRFRRPATEADLEPEADVRDRVVRSLGRQLGTPAARAAAGKTIAEVVELMLGRHDPATRNGALWAATVQAKRENPWADLLHDPRFRVINKSARALAALGDPRAIGPIIGMLGRHSNPRLLQAGAESLGLLIANICHDNPDWRAGNQQRIDEAITALVRLVREYGSDETLRAAVRGLSNIDVAAAAARLEQHLLGDVAQPALHAMVIVNTATALRGLVDQDNADRLFNRIEPRYRALPPGEPGRTALWEALYHLDPAAAHRLSAGEAHPTSTTLELADGLPAEPSADTIDARKEPVS